MIPTPVEPKNALWATNPRHRIQRGGIDRQPSAMASFGPLISHGRGPSYLCHFTVYAVQLTQQNETCPNSQHGGCQPREGQRRDDCHCRKCTKAMSDKSGGVRATGGICLANTAEAKLLVGFEEKDSAWTYISEIAHKNWWHPISCSVNESAETEEAVGILWRG